MIPHCSIPIQYPNVAEIRGPNALAAHMRATNGLVGCETKLQLSGTTMEFNPELGTHKQ